MKLFWKETLAYHTCFRLFHEAGSSVLPAVVLDNSWTHLAFPIMLSGITPAILYGVVLL